MKQFVIIFFTLLLSACASSAQQVAVDPAQDPSLGHDPAEGQLAEAATSVSKTLTSLEEIQQAVTPPPPHSEPPDPASYGMANLISMHWAGPITFIISLSRQYFRRVCLFLF